MIRAVVAIVLACALPGDADARCAMRENGPAVLTKSGETLPADGGILVGWAPVTRGPKYDGDPSRQPGWKLVADSRLIELTIESLAPGLSVYRAKVAGSSALTLSDADGKKVLDVTRGGKPGPVLPAPRPSQLVESERTGGRVPRTVLVAKLAQPAPEGAVAVITYAERDKQRVALSFATVDAGQPAEVTLYIDAERCTWNPPGMAAPKTGEAVRLAWVDRFGRVSATSAAIKVE